MDNKFFDHIVKAKLENMTSDTAPRWDLFKEKKSVHDSVRADRAFDNSIRRSFEEYKVPYNTGHWELLKQRLDLVYRIRKAVSTIKVYEVFGMLLLFYFASNNYNSFFDINTDVAAPIATLVENTNTEHPTIELKQDLPIAHREGEVITQQANRNIDQNKQQVTTTITSDSAINTANNKPNNMVSNSSTFLNQKTVVIEKEQAASTVTTEKSVNHELYQNLSPLAGIHSTIDFENNLFDLDEVFNAIKPIEKSPDGKFLHVAASFDNNQISTPFNEEYNPDGPGSVEMFGFTLSGLFSIRKGNLEYETGFGYSAYNKPLSFRRTWDNNIGEVFVYSLTNVGYDMFNVPLRVKYHFANTSDWSLYMTGGLVSDFIVNTGYDESNEKLPFNAPVPPGPTPTNPELTEIPFRTEANFHDGLLQGGTFKQNYLLRGQIGAGMERHISPTLSAYIAGDYYHSLLSTTFGPTDDTINKFSISFGIKERF